MGLLFFSTYVGFFALQETQGYGIKETFAVLSAGSVGVIVTPGGIGAYALLIKRLWNCMGLKKELHWHLAGYSGWYKPLLY